MSDTDCKACGSCGAEAWGYLWNDLVAEGWERRQVRGGQFFLCGVCVRRFAEARRLNRLFKRAPAAGRPLDPSLDSMLVESRSGAPAHIETPIALRGGGGLCAF